LVGTGAGHLATALGTFAADSGTLFHAAYLLATLGAGITDFKNFCEYQELA